MPMGDISQIEDVDYIWNGEKYADLTGKTNHYDWVIASHVIEHTPDLISFINDCDSILKEDGVLFLAVPDRRYCFDYFRPASSLSKVLDSHELKLTRLSSGTLAEQGLYAASLNGADSWQNADGGGEFTLGNTTEDVLTQLQDDRERDYTDAHNWVFVPHSFRMMIEDLHQMKLIALREAAFPESDDSYSYEFFAVLSRSGKGPGLSRIEMAKRMDEELLNPFSGKKQTVPINKRLRRLVRKGLRVFK